MLEEMDDEQIPAEYGGKNTTPLYESELEKQVLSFVQQIHKRS